jgi:hypothetical protein
MFQNSNNNNTGSVTSCSTLPGLLLLRVKVTHCLWWLRVICGNEGFQFYINKDLSYYKIIQAVIVRFFPETLRKYRAGPRLSRECTKTYNIPGTDIVLEKGVLTIIPILRLHHDQKYYPDSDSFDPERFGEEKKAKRHHYVYLPFGEGPRICIGTFTLTNIVLQRGLHFHPWTIFFCVCRGMPTEVLFTWYASKNTRIL